MDRRLLDLAAPWLSGHDRVLTPTTALASALLRRGVQVHAGELADSAPGSVDAVVLLGDELSSAGDHAEELLAAAASALRAGGQLLAAAPNRIHAAASGVSTAGRAWSAAELVRTIGHPGLAIEHVSAPGAAAGLQGDPCGPADLELDRTPGLLDAAPRTLVGARRPGDAAGRSAAFFASVPRKLVAAAVVCRDDRDRLLCVHDSFKRHWTIPGGVVDADEDPKSAATRETWEESGVRVRAGALLGVFSLAWPDRVLFVYAAEPLDTGTLTPVHTHEIDAVEWLALPAALARLNRGTAAQVRRCLDEPGETWADLA